MFSSNNDDSASNRNSNANLFLWLGLVCLLPLACLLLEIWNYPRLISGALSMRIVATSLLTQGEQPFYDFWDWSQPIVYELLKYPYMLCTALQTMHVPITHGVFISLFIFCLTVGFTLLTAIICAQALDKAANEEKESYRNFTVSCLIGLVLTTLITRFDFGDLQYLFLLTIVPWFALRWFAHNTVKVNPITACLTGVFAACGACLDIPYLAVFIILELTLALQSGRWRCLLSKEWLAFLLTFVTNFLILCQLPEPVHTAFWKWTMPLKWFNYSVFDFMICGQHACPDRADVIYSMVAAGAVSFLLGRKYCIFISLFSLMFSGFAIYLAEGRGSSNDLVLTIFSITTMFVSLLLLACKKVESKLSEKLSAKILNLSNKTGAFVLVLAATAGIWLSLERDRAQLQNCIYVNCSKGKEQLETLFEQTSKVGDGVTAICQNIAPAYPLLFVSGRKPAGYLLWGKPLWLFSILKSDSKLTGPMKDFYDHTYNNLRSEIDQTNTKLLIIENPEPFDSTNREQFFKTADKNFQDLNKSGHYFSYENHQPREYSGFNFPYRLLQRKKNKGI